MARGGSAIAPTARRSSSAARHRMKEEPTKAPMGPANVEPWTEVQQLAYEKESLGLYFSGHPIDRVAAELKGFGAKTTAEIGGDGRRAWVRRVQWCNGCDGCGGCVRLAAP